MGISSTKEKLAVDMDGPTAQIVKEKIANNCVMIFSKSYCPYCKMAKRAFDDLGAKYEVMELDRHPEGSQIQDVLASLTGSRSVPRVFVGGKCIGGGTETRDLHKSGELQKQLEACRESPTVES